jgi:hypothetical protein
MWNHELLYVNCTMSLKACLIKETNYALYSFIYMYVEFLFFYISIFLYIVIEL